MYVYIHVYIYIYICTYIYIHKYVHVYIYIPQESAGDVNLYSIYIFIPLLLFLFSFPCLFFHFSQPCSLNTFFPFPLLLSSPHPPIFHFLCLFLFFLCCISIRPHGRWASWRVRHQTAHTPAQNLAGSHLALKYRFG